MKKILLVVGLSLVLLVGAVASAPSVNAQPSYQPQLKDTETNTSQGSYDDCGYDGGMGPNNQYIYESGDLGDVTMFSTNGSYLWGPTSFATYQVDAAFTSDGNYLVVGTDDGSGNVTVAYLGNGTTYKTITSGAGEVVGVATHGNNVFISDKSGNLYIQNFSTGNNVFNTSVTASMDKSQVVVNDQYTVYTNETHIQVFYTGNWTKKGTIELPSSDTYHWLDIANDKVVVGDFNNNVYAANLSNMSIIGQTGVGNWVRDVELVKNGEYIVYGRDKEYYGVLRTQDIGDGTLTSLDLTADGSSGYLGEIADVDNSSTIWLANLNSSTGNLEYKKYVLNLKPDIYDITPANNANVTTADGISFKRAEGDNQRINLTVKVDNKTVVERTNVTYSPQSVASNLTWIQNISWLRVNTEHNLSITAEDPYGTTTKTVSFSVPGYVELSGVNYSLPVGGVTANGRIETKNLKFKATGHANEINVSKINNPSNATGKGATVLSAKVNGTHGKTATLHFKGLEPNHEYSVIIDGHLIAPLTSNSNGELPDYTLQLSTHSITLESGDATETKGTGWPWHPINETPPPPPPKQGVPGFTAPIAALGLLLALFILRKRGIGKKEK